MGIFDGFKKNSPQEKSGEERPQTLAKDQVAVAGRYQVGSRIGNRFQVCRILGGPGKSGMGIVYICYDHQSHQPVALKTFQDRFLSQRATVDRFKWEAEAWTRLEKHYNIVRALFVEIIDSRPFIILEYVSGDEQYGVDLSGWILGGGLRENGQANVPLILNFSLQFCHGMMHAKKKFLEMGKPFVHRDVKPSNILVTQDKVVKVTDFGLVRAYADSSEEISSTLSNVGGHHKVDLNRTEGICGPPPYMSPEQCRGEKEIGERSDVYSFGCVMYEMLTGGFVFEAKTPQDFIRHHRTTLPRSPNSHSELDKIVLRCLEKEGTKRYEGFEELEQVLAKLYKDVTGEVVRPPEAGRLEAWELNNKGGSLASLGFLDEAIGCYRESLRIDPKNAFAHNNLGNACYRKGELKAATREYQEALRINPNLGLAHDNLGVAYRAKGQVDAAIAEYQEALRIDANNASAHNNLGYAYHDKGQLEGAIAEFQKSLRINPNLSEAHNNLGVAYTDQGQVDAAIAEYQKALRIDADNASARTNLGNAYYDKGHLDAAIAEYGEALRINPNFANARTNLGNAYYAKGQLDAAMKEYREALRINPNDADAHLKLGTACGAKGQVDTAIAELKEGLRIRPNDAWPHYNLGILYKDKGQLDAAMKEYQEALRIDPNHANAHYNLGNAYCGKGNLNEAVRCYEAFVRLAPPGHESLIQEVKKRICDLKQRI